MNDPMKPNDLLEDANETTGVVQVAQQSGEQLSAECAVLARRVRRKYEALRNQVSGAYSHIEPRGKP